MPDGRRLLRHDRFDHIQTMYSELENGSDNGDSNSNLLRIHPSFRIIALAAPPERENLWLTAEVLGMFPFIETLPSLTVHEKIEIVASIAPPVGPESKELLEILRRVTERLSVLNEDPGSELKLSASLAESSFSPSCRQLLRLWLGSTEHLTSIMTTSASSTISSSAAIQECATNLTMRVRRMFMVPFMPHALRDAFNTALLEAMTYANTDAMSQANQTPVIGSNRSIEVDAANQLVRIGSAKLPLNHPERPELVPDTLFVDVPAHVTYLEEIAHDVLAGDKHVLLIGNQGNGGTSVNGDLCQYDVHVCCKQ